MRYQVFEDGEPAQYPEHDVPPSWSNSTFDTFMKKLGFTNVSGNYDS